MPKKSIRSLSAITVTCTDTHGRTGSPVPDRYSESLFSPQSYMTKLGLGLRLGLGFGLSATANFRNSGPSELRIRIGFSNAVCRQSRYT